MSLNRVKMNKLFNKETKQGKRNIIALTVVLYWIVFWILPSFLLSPFGTIMNFIINKLSIEFETLFFYFFIFYYILIAPIFGVIPYKILKDKLHILKKYKFKFFILTIIVPYIYICIYAIFILKLLFIHSNFSF